LIVGTGNYKPEDGFPVTYQRQNNGVHNVEQLLQQHVATAVTHMDSSCH